MGLILNSLISANVSAIGEVTIGVIDKELFDDLLQKVPEDLRVFFTALVERLKATTDKLGRIGVELEKTRNLIHSISLKDC
jgi:CRP-like cAMP-binding protein|tara:strand:- start:11 stop:253 length:243 start_codon:yes stop_codon:yes gene_type:complete